MSVAIGIDLGTTNSCVGVYQNGSVKIIPDAQGNNTIPSVVAFKGNRRLVGQEAVLQQYKNTENTFYDVKRIIGRKFDDDALQARMKRWPFKVELVKPDIPLLKTSKPSNGKSSFRPEEISGAVLSALKAQAEKYLKAPVKDAVITVPAYFNEVQRQATKDAAAIAQLNVLRIINEPTAAALAYGMNNIKGEALRYLLVIDIGGGTLDVTLLTIEDGIFDVKATNGDPELGGQDFTNAIVTHIRSKVPEVNAIISDKLAMEKLRENCETAKKKMLVTEEYEIEIPISKQAKNKSVTKFKLTRDYFDSICSRLYTRIEKTIEDLFQNSLIFGKHDVQDIILIGGSSKLLYLQDVIAKVFNGKRAISGVNPDEAVAMGAAIHAALLSGDGQTPKYTLCDVTPLTLGIATVNGLMSNVVPRNTKIPIQLDKEYETTSDDMTTMTFKIYEGERKVAENNILIGEFKLSNITKAPKGAVKITLTFDISSDGLMTITAVEKTKKGAKNVIQISGTSDRLEKEQIEQMINEGYAYKLQDEDEVERLKVKYDLEKYCIEVKKMSAQQTDEAVKIKLEEGSKMCMDYLEDNPDASIEELESQLRKIKMKCSSYM